MVYVPLLVFVAVAFWIAGWRKALEIALVSAFISLLFGLTFSANMREVPRNLWPGLLGVLYFPIYAVRHPSEWLYLLVPSAVLGALWGCAHALRKLWK